MKALERAREDGGTAARSEGSWGGEGRDERKET